MKKNLIVIVSLLLLVGCVKAQSINFQVQGEYGYGCLVPVDVYVDTQGQDISSIDLIMETSMDYVDFESTDALPYYMPPVKKDNGLIHIIGFSVEESERLNGNEKIGTLYFKQKNGENDGIVRLYFLGEGDTTDTNLSIAGGIDVLKQIGDVYVKFSSDLPACDQQLINEELGQIDGYSDKNFDVSLQETMDEIEKNHPNTSNVIDNEEGIINNGNLYFCIGIGVILLIVLIYVIYKILSNKKNSL